MASRRGSALGISRSVAASLAALLLLTGGLFIVSTLEEDHQEWVLVEDEVIADHGLYSRSPVIYQDIDTPEYTFDFDEETSTYTFDVTGGTKASSTNHAVYAFSALENFDYSKNYKIVVNNGRSYADFCYFSTTVSSTVVDDVFDLKSVSSGDDGYSASIILLDQLVTDFSYKEGFYITVYDSASSSSFEANTMTLQIYELTTDNAGSTAAGILGIVLIIMAVLATPAHNIFRRR